MDESTKTDPIRVDRLPEGDWVVLDGQARVAARELLAREKAATELRPVEGEPQHYRVYVADRYVGDVSRERHTVRTTYAYTRIGYDRTHWCWHASPQMLGGESFFDRRASWCHRTRKSAVDAVMP